VPALFLCLCISLLLPAAVFAQEEGQAETPRSEASDKSDASNESDAKESGANDGEDKGPGYEELLESLQSLPDDAEIVEELHAAYTSLEDPREAVKLIRRFLPVLESREKRYTTLSRLAVLEEALGELEQAQLHYQAAAFAVSGTQRYKALLNSANLLIRQGHYRQAQLQLTRITDAEEAGEFRLRAKLALVRAYLLDSETERARNMLAEISPKALTNSPRLLYRVALLAHTLGEKKLKDTVQELLYTHFPDSPESALMRGEAGHLPDIHSVFGLLETPRDTDAEKTAASQREDEERREKQSATAIQTGSFTDRENAVHLRKQLESHGFSVVIKPALIKETEYYRVLVKIGENKTLNEVIIELKEKGYEGYPVY